MEVPELLKQISEQVKNIQDASKALSDLLKQTPKGVRVNLDCLVVVRTRDIMNSGKDNVSLIHGDPLPLAEIVASLVHKHPELDRLIGASLEELEEKAADEEEHVETHSMCIGLPGSLGAAFDAILSSINRKKEEADKRSDD